MKTAAGLVVGFCAGFLIAAWCIGEGLKDGSLDDVVQRVWDKYPR